jgi:hypothetical protein
MSVYKSDFRIIIIMLHSMANLSQWDFSCSNLANLHMRSDDEAEKKS